MPSEPVISCRAATKVYRALRRRPGLRGILDNFVNRRWEEKAALRAVDLEVHAGEMVGLIGANGAGKTTLVKCLTGIVPVSSGEASLFGRDAFHLRRAEKRALSLVMGQRSQLWWDVPAADSFRLVKEIYQVERATFERRVGEFAERLGVTSRLGIPLRQLSLGERMKMEVIGAFLHDPRVVFLDEPTIGLDLVSQEAIREFLVEIRRERGATVVLTSHDMADIEQTCERIVILEEGRVLFDGDLVDLLRRVKDRRAVEVHLEPGARGWHEGLEAEIAPLGATLQRRAPLTLTFDVAADRTQALVRCLMGLVDVRDLSVERQPLEALVREVFRTRELRG